MGKITPAMKDWCKRLERGERCNSMTYDMAGRMRDAGLITIEKERQASNLEWPWGNWRPVLVIPCPAPSQDPRP